MLLSTSVMSFLAECHQGPAHDNNIPAHLSLLPADKVKVVSIGREPQTQVLQRFGALTECCCWSQRCAATGSPPFVIHHMQDVFAIGKQMVTSVALPVSVTLSTGSLNGTGRARERKA